MPFSVWWDGLRGLVHARRPGRLHCMGHRVGYLAGMRGERREVRAIGLTFPDDEKNTALWKRGMGFLKLDMWWCSSAGP